jgi:CRISPR-associated protein Cmr4
MSFLAETALPVRMRNRLDDLTKTVEGGALWAEETVAPETVFSMIMALRPHAGVRRKGATDSPATLACKFLETLAGKAIQVGGNETIGQGWLRVGTLAPDPGTVAKAVETEMAKDGGGQ